MLKSQKGINTDWSLISNGQACDCIKTGEMDGIKLGITCPPGPA